MTSRYVALGPLLSGEGSRAFLGLKITDGEASPCVLVWVPERVMAEPELVEQLRRETSRAAGLDHPNVVKVHGLIEVDEGLARVVDFADGESLRRVLDVGKRLPGGFAARVAVDAALGVQYAHLAGNEDGSALVHGDLRPETLLVSYSGVTRVSGYGALSVAPKEMGGQRVIGRRAHCAPEQILGGRQAVTAQTDVYLLGLILYECLTGEVPFVGEKDFDKAVLNKHPPQLNSEYVPPRLRPVIGKAMAKKGNLRFPSVQAFREAIEEAVDVPAHAELGAFLDKAFEADDTRATRRRELDNGIQEWVTKKGLKLAPPPKPPPAPPPKPAPIVIEAPPVPAPQAVAPVQAAPPAVPAVPVAVSAPAVVVAPPPPAPAPSPAVARVEPERRGVSPWAIAFPLVVVCALAAYWAGQRSQGTDKPEAPKPALVVAGPDTAAAVVAKPEVVAPPTPTPTPVPTPPPEQLPALRPQIPTLEVVVDPPVTVTIDGQVAGKSPLKAELPIGTHKIALTDPSQGIALVRKVTIKPGANHLAVTVGRGAVTVSAPPGAEVRIDGRLIGKTPLPGPVPVMEGSHRIQVMVGPAKWQQAFTLGDNERMNFEVETQGGE